MKILKILNAVGLVLAVVFAFAVFNTLYQIANTEYEHQMINDALAPYLHDPTVANLNITIARLNQTKQIFGCLAGIVVVPADVCSGYGPTIQNLNPQLAFLTCSYQIDPTGIHPTYVCTRDWDAVDRVIYTAIAWTLIWTLFFGVRHVVRKRGNKKLTASEKAVKVQ